MGLMFFFRIKSRDIINCIIMSKSNGKVYYAVGRGREIGIYDTWQECKSQVDGFDQAKYRKFFSLDEAKEFVNFWKNYSLTDKQQPELVSNYNTNYKTKASNKILEPNCNWTIETNVRNMYSPPKIYKMKNYFTLGCDNNKVESYENKVFNMYKVPYVSPINSSCKTKLSRKPFSENIKKRQIGIIENISHAIKKYPKQNFMKNNLGKEEISSQKSNIHLVSKINTVNPSHNLCGNSKNRSENISVDIDLVKPSAVKTCLLKDNEQSCTNTLFNENDNGFNRKILSHISKQLCDSIGLLNSVTKYISKEHAVSLENIEKSLILWMESLKTNGHINLQIGSETNISSNTDSLMQLHNEETEEQTIQDTSFSQKSQSSPVMSLMSPSLQTASDSKREAKNVDILALNLRLDSFEKRFDACLKEIGAITSQISQIKSEIKEIKEQVSPKINSWNNYSPNKSKDLSQTTINFKQNEETTKSSTLKRKLSGDCSKDSKRLNVGTDGLEYYNIKMEAVDYTSFTMDADEYVHVYTDGACHSNGKTEAKAGIGIWFGDCHPLNISEPVRGCATNNSAEIQAARIAMVIANKAGIKKLKIFTDSSFLINCATRWIYRWKKNGWKLVKGGEVKNRTELEKLDEIRSKLDVQWVKVEGHSGIHGNEMADRLANEGATKYKY